MDVNALLIVSAAFASIAGVAFVFGQFYVGRAQVKRRLTAGGVAVDTSGRSGGRIGSFVADHFTEDRFGVDDKLRQKLRRELLRAGFFSNDAIRYYVFARICSVAVLPFAVFIATRLLLPGAETWIVLLLVAISAGLGILGPDAYLSRRHTNLVGEYRVIFPDLLDLVIVCVSAGLSLDASFERVRGQLAKRSAALGLNLELMGAEMRAGRSSIDALNSFADRLGLDEASSFVAVLRQSVELGGDVASSLRVFSDEMRIKRMLRAEQRANELPVKMIIPLGLGIFPVVLELVLLPVMITLMKVFSSMS
jgi:tight adherence protein C